MQSEQRCKTQAQKKQEHAEKSQRIAAEKEAERAQRAELHQREAREEQDRQRAAQQKKEEAKLNKKKAATAAAATAAAASSPILPSVSTLAHLPEPRVGGIVRGADDDDESSLQPQLECDLSSLSVSSSSSSSSSARVAYNHSTYLDGLRVLIAKLEKTPLIKTIHPGELSGGHANAQTFELVFQSDSNDGAFHFVAKKGSMRQDLRITPKNKIVKRAMIEQAIDDILNPPQTAASEAASSSSASAAAPIAVNSNRIVAELAAAAHRQAGHAKHVELRDKEKAAEHARKVHEKEKKLKAKVGQKNESVGALAKEWVQWEK